MKKTAGKASFFKYNKVDFRIHYLLSSQKARRTNESHMIDLELKMLRILQR